MAQAKKRKKFFNVSIPLIKKETQLLAYDLENLKGRYVKYDLTRTLRGKSTMFQAKVKIEGDSAVAYPTKIQLMPYYLKRMVRKGTNYVEDSFSVECKDAVIRIKPFLITRRKVSRAVRKALREKAREELTKYAKSRNSEEIFQDVLRNSLQKTLSLILKKVYPLSLCEIRILRVEKEKTE
jgi:ribosomal protein S3AE